MPASLFLQGIWIPTKEALRPLNPVGSSLHLLERPFSLAIGVVELRANRCPQSRGFLRRAAILAGSLTAIHLCLKMKTALH